MYNTLQLYKRICWTESLVEQLIHYWCQDTTRQMTAYLKRKVVWITAFERMKATAKTWMIETNIQTYKTSIPDANMYGIWRQGRLTFRCSTHYTWASEAVGVAACGRSKGIQSISKSGTGHGGNIVGGTRYRKQRHCEYLRQRGWRNGRRWFNWQIIGGLPVRAVSFGTELFAADLGL